jgi:pyruvate kinase
MKPRVLCTLGPASLNAGTIRRLEELGANLFRINLSHTALEAVQETIEFVQRNSSTPLCIDTEGAQVRCGVVAAGLILHEGDSVRLTAEVVQGSAAELTLRPESVFQTLRPGNLVSIDFHGARLRVTRTDWAAAEATVIEGGRVGSNKAVTIDPAPVLPPLTEKDVDAIGIALECGIENYALSFASGASEVMLLRSLLPADAYVISKIESRAGVREMDQIIAASDAVLIDRGDLSREIPLERVPLYQKLIIRRANSYSTPVFVATNLLESMVANRLPTVAEANDIANTLMDGAHGLVLAAETAVGEFPVESMAMVIRMVQAFKQSHDRLLEDDLLLPRSALSGPGEDQIDGVENGAWMPGAAWQRASQRSPKRLSQEV